MNALAFNAGSSSLKFGLFEDAGCEPIASGEIDWADGDRQQARLIQRSQHGSEAHSIVAVPDDFASAVCVVRAAMESASFGNRTPPDIGVVGHRVVHGGTAFRDSVLIDDRVKAAIGDLSDLAPLHNPPTLRAIEAVTAALPGVPQVAVFDTAFYSQLPQVACVYPLPYEWYSEWGIRRFGFHGISHGYCVGRAAEMMGRDLAQLRIISCHLGGGCSATAIRNGKAVATTMGFSPLEGLMMGTRSGSIDPGILLEVQRERGLSLPQLDDALNHASGLLGVSGVSPDLAHIEIAAAQGNERARLAFDMFADRLRSAIGSLAATLGGVDALIFTDRIGTNSSALRAAACAGLEFMGVRLDSDRNAGATPDADITADGSLARILVLRTREELMVAREALRVVGGCAVRNPARTTVAGPE